jgi:TrmH family RNA methyltransferase
MKEITSIQNTFIKNILKLQEKARERKKQGLFLIEGKREIELAKKGGYEITSILFLSTVKNDALLSDFQNVDQILITQEIFDKLAYRNTTEGFLAIAKTKSLLLSDIQLSENPLILVAESIEKPGNIGAILRTADAAKIDAVLIADAKSDLYNPNIIRSSVGCVFTNQIATATSQEIIDFLQSKNIDMYAATLQNSNEYHKENYTKPAAIIVGTEDTGLTEIWRKNATQNINIPMQGMIDSMNVSVAAAILLFEAKRQRNF